VTGRLRNTRLPQPSLLVAFQERAEAVGRLRPIGDCQNQEESLKKIAFMLVCIHVYSHMYMKTEAVEDVRRWFVGVIRDLWPVAVGSLSLRKGPCIRPKCPTCSSGKAHSSFALYGRQGDRRFSIYVPERLVPKVRAAIQNGRRLQELTNEAGVRYVNALKRQDSKANK
jgi:hypothetical protein